MNAISTTTKVEIKDEDDVEIKLRQEEKIALMFMQAISSLESDCRLHLGRVCSLDELVKQPDSPAWHIGKLKFDPAKDTNYNT